MTNHLTDVEARIASLRASIKAAEEQFKAQMDGLAAEMGLAIERRAHLLDGLDEGKILLASHVIYKRGRYHEFGGMPGLLLELKAALVAGGNRLRDEYLGLKNYDRWVGQRSNHPYGFGPRHGSIVFAVGLLPPVRERSTDPLLTPDEIEACLYWVGNLAKIQAAEDAANAAKAQVAQ